MERALYLHKLSHLKMFVCFSIVGASTLDQKSSGAEVEKGYIWDTILESRRQKCNSKSLALEIEAHERED